jgi:hypothetical protein
MWCLSLKVAESGSQVTVKATRTAMVPHLPPRFGHRVGCSVK